MHPENLVHHHFDVKNHVTVEMDIDGAFVGKQLTHQFEAFAHEVKILINGKAVIVSMLEIAGFKCSSCIVRRVDVDECYLFANLFILGQKAQHIKVVGMI